MPVSNTLAVPSRPSTHGLFSPSFWRPSTWHAILLTLTFVTFLIHGYHPLAEDGGLYLAGIQHQLDSTLFPHYTAFVTEHLRFSLFVPFVVALIRVSHLPFAWVILLVDLFTLWLTFYAARKIMVRCIANPAAQLAGLCLLGALWTLPIAGTSLYLMDPYLTGRSLSTPLSLLAIAYALDPWRSKLSASKSISTRSSLPSDEELFDRLPSPHPLLACALALFVAVLFHPLMAFYALAFIVVLRVDRLPRRIVTSTILLLIALALAATCTFFAPPEPPAVLAAEFTRYYWFLSQWQWFELLGLAAPLGIFALFLFRLRHRRSTQSHNMRALCRASIVLGLMAIAVALLFAHRDAPTHLVARLQPLRSFLFLYAIMVLLLGAAFTQWSFDSQPSSGLNRRLRRAIPTVLLFIAVAAMFTVQRLTFPASPHLELPFTTTQNPWSRAFLWARDNTPPDALFALDAKYVNEPGEDAQTFRATALRSALPDYSKDGGEAAITPALAPLWQSPALAQSGLSSQLDPLRDANLQRFHVTWMVLRSQAVTAHPCPYDNGTIKVCRLN